MLTGHFIKVKLHCRGKAKCRKCKLKFGLDQALVRAAEDYKDDREWLIEKNLLANVNDSFFAVPNVLILAKNPWVPITNPTDHPRYIRKGEVVGSIQDPQEFFDSPKTTEEWEQLAASATVIETLICSQSEPRTDDGDNLLEDYGPKTVAMPDPTFYPSLKLEELVDVGTLPEHLKARAWEMLCRREKAFGFDGCLGHLDAKVHIRTVDGQVPISAPMYGTSPEKRKIIEAQLEK